MDEVVEVGAAGFVDRVAGQPLAETVFIGAVQVHNQPLRRVIFFTAEPEPRLDRTCANILTGRQIVVIRTMLARR